MRQIQQIRDKLTGVMRDLRRVADVSAHPFVLVLPTGWPEQPGVVHWGWHDTQGQYRAGTVTDLSELPPEAHLHPPVVLTPGAETLLASATLPTRSRAKILQALPFALEEQLLGEPEGMEFSYRALDDGELAVAVTARERLQAWLDALQAAGLRPSALAPVTLSLPFAEGEWSAAFFDDALVVRTGAFSGFACMVARGAVPAMLLAAIREALAGERMPVRLRVLNAPEAFDAASWSDTLALPVISDSTAIWPQLATLPPLNLLQGSLASGSNLHPGLRRMRPAAIMFGIWIIAGFGFNLVEWWQLSHAAKLQRAEMITLFQKAFPEAKVVVDPALQMQRNLADLQSRGGSGSPGDLLPLLGQIAPVIQANRAIELNGIQYSEQSATLDLHLPDFQAIESFSNALGAKGLQVSVVNSNSRGAGGVDSRVRVSAVRKS